MATEHLLDGRLKLRHLVLMAAIAEHGSLVKCAEALHITQPVLSRALKELESILEVRLFDRVPTGLTPTLFGEAFIVHTRTILGEVRQAGQDLTNLAQARTGTVRVGTHLAGSNLLLPKSIERFKTARPNVTVVVREATPDVLVSSLLAGELDVTIGRLTALPQDGLSQETLYREPIAFVTRREHPAHAKRRPRLADLVRYPWILPVEQTALRNEVEHLFIEQSLPLPANRIECTSILTLRSLLLSNDIIAALPLLIAQEDAGLSVLKTRTSLEALRRPVGVTYVQARLQTPTLRAFLEEMHTVADEISRRAGIRAE